MQKRILFHVTYGMHAIVFTLAIVFLVQIHLPVSAIFADFRAIGETIAQYIPDRLLASP
jgi:hypothetical protein